MKRQRKNSELGELYDWARHGKKPSRGVGKAAHDLSAAIKWLLIIAILAVVVIVLFGPSIDSAKAIV